MKILHVGDLAFVGSNLCRELRQRGIAADILSKKKFCSENQLDHDWFFYVDGIWDEFRHHRFDINAYDLIHAHYLVNWGSLGLCFQNIKRPVILHAHGLDLTAHSPLEFVVQKMVAQLSNTMFYSTPDLHNKTQWFKGDVQYLPNPVVIPAERIQSYTFEKKILIYTTIYKIKQIENIFNLVKDMPYTFDIIDSGPDRAYYKMIAPENVTFIEPIERVHVQKRISAYPLVLGGSYDGTIRVSELEAMSLGIPTLFPFKYDACYKEALPMREFSRAAIEQSRGDYAFGQQQREWVKKYHSVEVVADQLLQVYQQHLTEYIYS